MSHDLNAGKLPEARPQRTKGMQRTRLGAKSKALVEIMAYEGVPLSEAAERVGMTMTGARGAMRKTHVRQSYNQLVREIRENAAQEAYLGIRHMSHTANSENTRFEAKKWVAGVDGLAPLKRVEGKFSHSHSFAGFSYGEGAVDVTPAHDIASSGDDSDPTDNTG